MATWASRSFDLVRQGGYLDRLSVIYPVASPAARQVGEAQRSAIWAALSQRDDGRLLKALLGLKGLRFPFNDPYVSFLRANELAIGDNPQTVKRICDRLRSMGAEGVLEALEKPVEANRQMGPAFSNWLRSRYPGTKDESEFEASRVPVLFLMVSEAKLRDFANRKGCALKRRPDFVAKASGRYVVGEARFIGAEGGNQGLSFDDALSLANQSPRDAISVAVLDGIIWIPGSGQMSRRLEKFSGYAFSALLLDDFLRSL